MAIKDVIRLCRPVQWSKNSFVFAGLLFDQAWGDSEVLVSVLQAFFAFCFVASAVYILNDTMDREEDRRHPTKCNRPIASGAVSIPIALAVLAVLLVGGFTLGYLASPNVAIILGIYMVMNIGYSMGLKRVVILDVFIIAGGFLLRILAGTIGVGMEPSAWLFLCSLCLTLFMGFGKRRAELTVIQGSNEENGSRQVLGDYSPVLLDIMMAVVAACTFVSYGLFTMSEETVARHGTTALLYTLPIVMYAMFRYFFMIHKRGQGEDPSDVIMRDPHILLAGAAWLVATFLIIR